MDIGETLDVMSREAWREWLDGNRQDKREIWVVCYKKSSGQPSVPYHDLVEEAICFGWADGMAKSMDEKRFALRFTPRRKKSSWADSNIARVGTMLREGKMTEAGLAVVSEAVLESVRGSGAC